MQQRWTGSQIALAGKGRGRSNYKIFTLYRLHRADYIQKYNCNIKLQYFQDAPTIKPKKKKKAVIKITDVKF